MEWLTKKFDELPLDELYACLQLRNEVFIVEQNCFYQDADDYDQLALHLMGWKDEGLQAYARLLPPGVKYAEWAIGRVVLSKQARGNGAGRLLMQQAMDIIKEKGGDVIRLSAQAYLEKFYLGLGFQPQGAPYDEAGIPHIEMVWNRT